MPGVPPLPWDPQPSTGVHSRGIDTLHPAVVADAVGGVPQVVALVVDAVGSLLVGQVPLQLVLGRPVGPLAWKSSCQCPVWLGEFPRDWGLPRASLLVCTGLTEGVASTGWGKGGGLLGVHFTAAKSLQPCRTSWELPLTRAGLSPCPGSAASSPGTT